MACHLTWLAVTSARTSPDHNIMEAFLVITTRCSQNNMDLGAEQYLYCCYIAKPERCFKIQ